MNRFLLLFLAALLISSSGSAQRPIPVGASKFFKELGGLNPAGRNPDIFKRVAGNKIDEVEGGGGAADWTQVDGRVFVRAAWMEEIGEFKDNYGPFELEQGLAAEMKKKLIAEGFQLSPARFDLHYIRYQKGTTVGTVEVRSFFLNAGNLPLRYEFIFNESYRTDGKSGRHLRRGERKLAHKHL